MADKSSTSRESKFRHPKIQIPPPENLNREERGGGGRWRDGITNAGRQEQATSGQRREEGGRWRASKLPRAEEGGGEET
jgi:hypothetical protein